MTGMLAQICSLVSYGNEYLKTGAISGKYFPGNSVFSFCNTVDFKAVKKRFFTSGHKEILMAENPVNWFGVLKSQGCRGLRLIYMPSKSSTDILWLADHKLAGFVGGGGAWLIETQYDDYLQYWANQWKVTDPNAPEGKVWSVNYSRILSEPQVDSPVFFVNQEKERLEKILTEISAFSSGQNLEYWADIFLKAKAILQLDNPWKEYYYTDLIVNKNYPLAAQQTLFAAASAWVFGGMGSWNDLGFHEQNAQLRYEQLSAQLFAAINSSILAVINEAA